MRHQTVRTIREGHGRLRRFAALAALVLQAVCAPSRAETAPVEAPVGRPVSDVIDDWRRRGVPFAYSTELVDETVVVVRRPGSTEAVAMVSELLAPYGLRLLRVEGLLVVGREPREIPTPAEATPGSVPEPPAEPALAEVTVSASRYELLRERLHSRSHISQRTIEQLPLLGEDPLRAVRRLPGNATSGLSARSHLRGSGERDTGLVLNGKTLLDPFHIRDYQNLFSAIDARAVAGVEVYTGGFPVKYGDSMGGLVLIDSLEPEERRRTEIGISMYNTSFLSAGRAADDRLAWLVSARRGNLDLVLDGELGEPSYSDLFAEVAVDVSPETRIAFNALVASDDVLAVTESDPAERETSMNDTRNAQVWINWSQDWTDDLTSMTTLSLSSLNSDRLGAADDEEEIVARVDDRRDIDILGLGQDWSADLGGGHRLAFGLDFRRLEADFRYVGQVDWFGDFARFAELPDSQRRDLTRAVRGESIGLYLGDRLKLGERSVVEVGLRWDRQTYTGQGGDAQISPRLSVVRQLGSSTELRLSAGRYWQPQGIEDLQIEDGIDRYFPAERADHLVVGLERQSKGGLAWRIEAYYKDMGELRPRFENSLDPLAVMPELKPDRVRIDARDAQARGIELSVGRESDGPLDWWLSYSLSEAEDRIGGRHVPRSWDQRHAAQAGLLWAAGRWDASVVVSAHSGWPKTEVRIRPGSDPLDPEFEFTARNGGRFPAFATLDARLAYRMPVTVGELTMFLEVSNATDRHNPCCVDFGLQEDVAGPPVVGLVEEGWYPLLPAVGLLWEF